MVVVECTATLLDSGKTFFKVGEANPSNLEGEISKNIQQPWHITEPLTELSLLL